MVLWFWNNHLKKKHGMASALDLKNKQDQQEEILSKVQKSDAWSCLPP